MNVIIRQEREADYQEVFLLTEKAFRNLEISDHREQFLSSGSFGIIQPFEAPDECCMVVELVENALFGVHGKVVYPKEFFE